MKNEKVKFPKEKEMLNRLLKDARDARRYYLKYEVFSDIMLLLQIAEDRSDSSKWEKLYKLQKRINIVEYDLGKEDADILIQEVTETISEYLFKNKDFKEEAFDNVDMLSQIQKKKVKTLEQIFRMEDKD